MTKGAVQPKMTNPTVDNQGMNRQPESVSKSIAPFSQQQLDQVAAASKRGKKVRRAAGVARLSGMTLVFFTVTSLLSGIFDITGVFVGLALAPIAWCELRGASQLRKFDLGACRWLAFNQLALCVFVVVYAGWNLWKVMVGPDMYAEYIAADPAMAEMLGPIGEMSKMITFAVYTTLIPTAVVFQGGMALYYLTRKRILVSYREQTPEWVVQLQQVA